MVKRIFHFSDFHINPECGDQKENQLFNKIILSIKNNYENNPEDCNYIVYTGDIVDAKGKEGESQKQYEERINASYKLAKEYFTRLMKTLGVSSDRLIICAGNHDKTRDGAKTNKCLCSSEINYNYSIYESAYKKYVSFAEEMVERKIDYNSSFYSVDNLNFLILNSTWQEKEAEYDDNSKAIKSFDRCIDCKGVLSVIEKHGSDYVKEGVKNILICHDPITSWCDFTKWAYPESKENYVKSKIDQYFDYKLCGDVHADGFSDGFHSIASIISNSQKASYGCIELKENGDEYIVHVVELPDEEKTTDKIKLFVDQKKDIVELSSISQEKYYVKKLALRLLNGRTDNSVTSNSIISASETLTDMFTQDNQKWKKLNAFFEMVSNLKDFRDNTKPLMDSNIIHLVTKYILAGTGSIRMIVKSRPSQGKSTFLSVLYMFLLGLFFEGEFPYIPVYFNQEKIMEKSLEDKKRVFSAFFERAIDYSNKMSKPVCFIIDGFYQRKYSDDSFDNHVFDEYMAFEENANIYVAAVDTDEHMDDSKSLIGAYRLTDFVLYFRDIELKSVNEQNAENFIKTLSELLGIKDYQKISNNIKNSGIEYVDMNLVARHGEIFSKVNQLVDIFGLYGRKLEAIKKEKPDVIAKCAYQIMVQNRNPYSLVNETGISWNAYYTLYRQRELGMYYCAKHYFNEIKTYSRKREPLPSDSILNNFFSHEQYIFLKILRDKNEVSTEEIIDFLGNHFKEVSYLGKSQLIYLFGRKKTSQEEPLFKKASISLEKKSVSEINEKTEKFKAEIMNRAITIVSGFEDGEKLEEYIMNLLKNPTARRVNRAANMLYYSDVKFENAKKIYFNNTIFKGNDIYHTFLILSHRLRHSTHGINRKLLDLVTLCDLMEHRFRQPIACELDGEKTFDCIFYTSSYINSAENSPKQILNEFIKTINSISLDDVRNNIIKIYIQKCVADAEYVLSYFDRGAFLDAGTFHQSNSYVDIKEIEKQERKGWKIGEVLGDGMPDKAYEDADSLPMFETVEEHIYQSYLIGLLYLPVVYPEKYGPCTYSGVYDKQKILNILLTHDIGKCVSGDWPSFFEHHYKADEEENTFNNQLFIRGAFSETSNLIEYLELWVNWNKTKHGIGDINAIIAKELDAIQFLFKYKSLLKEGKLGHFDESRKAHIERTREKIKTEIGTKILAILIDENPIFA